MGYGITVGLSEEAFRRLRGVKRATFMKMVELLTASAVKAQGVPKWRGGRNPVVSIEDKLMICLESSSRVEFPAACGVNYSRERVHT